MSLKRFNVGKAGLDVAGVSLVAGAGAPDGTGVSADLPIGSLYINATNGNMYKKIGSGNTSADFAILGEPMPVAPTIITGKTQANGAFTSAPYASGFVPPLNTSIGVEASATPTAGTLLVEYRMNGMSAYKVADTINLVSPIDILLTGYAFDFRFTPTGFDSDKTYNVVIAGKD